MHLAARHPERVRSLSLHSTWGTTDAFLRTCLENWRALARALPTVADAVILGIFPWCFTPEMYAQRPEFVQALDEFVRGRPAQPLDAFLVQSQAVIDHDAGPVLKSIAAPTLVTFGAHDLVTSMRFAEPLTSAIPNTALVVFEQLSHAGLREGADTFNAATLDFLLRQPDRPIAAQHEIADLLLPVVKATARAASATFVESLRDAHLGEQMVDRAIATCADAASVAGAADEALSPQEGVGALLRRIA